MDHNKDRAIGNAILGGGSLVRWMFGILLQNYWVALVKGFCYLAREKDVVCDQCLFIRCFSLYIWGKIKEKPQSG